MNLGLVPRTANPAANKAAEPRLNLLLELEPRSRAFFANFTDLLFHRDKTPIDPTYKHFYIRTGVSGAIILETMAWQLVALPFLLAAWTLASGPAPGMPLKEAAFVPERITYSPTETFPARGGRQNSTPRQHVLKVAAERRSLAVAPPKVALGGSALPKIAAANPALPPVPFGATARTRAALRDGAPGAVAPAPDVHPVAMRGFSSETSAVVGPPPQVSGVRRAGGLGADVAAVAPSPALEGVASGRRAAELGAFAAVAPAPGLPGRGRRGMALAGVGTSVVPPAPSMRGQIVFRGGYGNSGGGSDVEVVAPSPSVSHALSLSGGAGNSLSSGMQVVPPAPSVHGQVGLPGGKGVGNSLGGLSMEVVAPSPSLGNAPTLASGGGGSLAGVGLQVVPPPPSVRRGEGLRGGGGGRSLGSGAGQAVGPAPGIGRSARLGGGSGGRSLGYGAGQAVPPAPGIGQLARLGGGGQGSLDGAGMQIVPPAPSGARSGMGGGNGGNGMGGNGRAGLDLQALPPSGGVGGAGGGASAGGGSTGSDSASGNGSPGGTQNSARSSGSGSGSGSDAGSTTVAALEPLPGNGAGGEPGTTPVVQAAIPPKAKTVDIPKDKTEILPLRLIQLAVALPTTSYFSNYEAFLAERSVSRNATQLIKLVYVFLPYQRRLTEYGVNTSKTFNLRVTRDPSCDESLISMTWSETNANGEPKADTPQASKDKLPCYRTTADDYRKALGKAK